MRGPAAARLARAARRRRRRTALAAGPGALCRRIACRGHRAGGDHRGGREPGRVRRWSVARTEHGQQEREGGPRSHQPTLALFRSGVQHPVSPHQARGGRWKPPSATPAPIQRMAAPLFPTSTTPPGAARARPPGPRERRHGGLLPAPAPHRVDQAACSLSVASAAAACASSRSSKLPTTSPEYSAAPGRHPGPILPARPYCSTADRALRRRAGPSMSLAWPRRPSSSSPIVARTRCASRRACVPSAGTSACGRRREDASLASSRRVPLHSPPAHGLTETGPDHRSTWTEPHRLQERG